jgi:hypothetical protein
MTAQIAEYLRYQGDGVRMCTEPLGDYFAMGGRNPKFTASNTANWRGYIGGWEIVAGRLYLVKITGVLEDGSDASLETVFPGFPDRVFAHWYTGTIRIPRGKMLQYVHGGYGSLYERDEMLDLERGVIRRTWIRYNGVSDAADGPEGYRIGAMTTFAREERAGSAGRDGKTEGGSV